MYHTITVMDEPKQGYRTTTNLNHEPKQAIKWLRPDNIVKSGVPVLFSDEHELLQVCVWLWL